jgi:hypothetical protein
VVIVLAIGLTFTGPNSAKDDGFLWAIKIGSTTSFGGEVKLLASCHRHKVSQHVKRSLRSMTEIHCHQNLRTFLANSLLCY